MLEGLFVTFEISVLLLLCIVWFSIGVGGLIIFWLFNRDDAKNIRDLRAFFKQKAEEEGKDGRKAKAPDQ